MFMESAMSPSKKTMQKYVAPFYPLHHFDTLRNREKYEILLERIQNGEYFIYPHNVIVFIKRIYEDLTYVQRSHAPQIELEKEIFRAERILAALVDGHIRFKDDVYEAITKERFIEEIQLYLLGADKFQNVYPIAFLKLLCSRIIRNYGEIFQNWTEVMNLMKTPGKLKPIIVFTEEYILNIALFVKKRADAQTVREMQDLLKSSSRNRMGLISHKTLEYLMNQ